MPIIGNWGPGLRGNPRAPARSQTLGLPNRGSGAGWPQTSAFHNRGPGRTGGLELAAGAPAGRAGAGRRNRGGAPTMSGFAKGAPPAPCIPCKGSAGARARPPGPCSTRKGSSAIRPPDPEQVRGQTGRGLGPLAPEASAPGATAAAPGWLAEVGSCQGAGSPPGTPGRP